QLLQPAVDLRHLLLHDSSYDLLHDSSCDKEKGRKLWSSALVLSRTDYRRGAPTDPRRARQATTERRGCTRTRADDRTSIPPTHVSTIGRTRRKSQSVPAGALGTGTDR